MSFRDTTKAELLGAIQRFYRERLQLPEEAVFPTVQPMSAPTIRPGGEYWVGISPDDGMFPLEEQDDEQLRESCQWTIMAYTSMQTDWVGRDELFLLDPTRGALYLQSRLLLIVGAELKDELGVGLIASRVYAVGSVKPSYDSHEMVGWTGIRIVTEFDWSIVGAEDLGDD